MATKAIAENDVLNYFESNVRSNFLNLHCYSL